MCLLFTFLFETILEFDTLCCTCLHAVQTHHILSVRWQRWRLPHDTILAILCCAVLVDKLVELEHDSCELLNADEDSWLAQIVTSQICCHLNVQRYFHAEYLPSDIDIVPSKKKSGSWRQKRTKMQAAILFVCTHSFGLCWVVPSFH